MKLKKKQYFFLLIFLVGFILRFISAVKNDFWVDEATGFFISTRFSLGDIVLGRADPPHNFLYYLLLRLISRINTSVLFLRMPSLVLSLMNMVLVYKIAEKLKINKYFALTCLALFAVSPYQIEYAWWARMYAMVLFFSLASIYFLIKLYFSKRKIWGVLFIAANFLGYCTDYSFIWYLLVLNIILFSCILKNWSNIKYLLVSDLLILLCSPILINNFSQILDSKIFWIEKPNLNILKATILWFLGIKDPWDKNINNIWILPIALVVIFNIMIVKFDKKKIVPSFILLFSLFFPVTISYIVSHVMRSSIFLWRNFISISVAPIFLVALIISFFIERRKLFFKLLGILILAFILYCNFNLYLYQTSGIYFPRTEGWFYKKAAQLVRNEIDLNNESVICLNSKDALFNYYFYGFFENQKVQEQDLGSFTEYTVYAKYAILGTKTENLWIIIPPWIDVEDPPQELEDDSIIKYLKANNEAPYKIGNVYKIKYADFASQ